MNGYLDHKPGRLAGKNAIVTGAAGYVMPRLLSYEVPFQRDSYLEPRPWST
jgi:hypothetical protein